MASPRFADLPPLLIAGMREPLHDQSPQTIPILWQNFAPFIGKIPHQKGSVAYGLCVQSSESSNGCFYYMAGCEVNEFADLPAALSPLIVPAHKYAVFVHETHFSKIKDTIDYVFDKWLPQSGYKHSAQSINFFERYVENFNPENGFGDMEIWLPVV
ncbi:MAG: AraC family transcriptional regulator [Gammaproteobacteria bacterium]|nr:MAG: AraC family transcriptional regulator [Gammaproteobacteria bacterium]